MSGIQPGTIAMHLSRRAQFTNAEVLEQFLAAGKKKAAYGHLKLFFLSVLGGLFLGLGRLRPPLHSRQLPAQLLHARGDELAATLARARGASRVRGVGGSDGESSGATRAYRGELNWLELDPAGAEADASAPRGYSGSGGRFEKLDVLLAADSGFDLSEHSVGLICANALNTRRVVYDVPNRRVALLVAQIRERGREAPSSIEALEEVALGARPGRIVSDRAAIDVGLNVNAPPAKD